MSASARYESMAPANLSLHAHGGSEVEAMRQRLFNQFNAFWTNAADEGVPYDMIGTMAVTATIYGLVAKHGAHTTMEFLENLAEAVGNGEFCLRS